MRRCVECDYFWDGRPAEALAVVRSLPGALSGLVSERDARLRVRPAPSVWSVMEYVGHTGDAIGWYGARIQRVLTEERPVLEPFDWDVFTERQRYHERRVEDVLEGVSATCGAFVGRLAELPDGGWQRSGIGSDGQPRTVAQLAHRAAHEAQHHLHDTRRGLVDVQL